MISSFGKILLKTIGQISAQAVKDTARVTLGAGIVFSCTTLYDRATRKDRTNGFFGQNNTSLPKITTTDETGQSKPNVKP